MKIKMNNKIVSLVNEGKKEDVTRTSTFEELMDSAISNGDLDKDELDEEDENLSEYTEQFNTLDLEDDDINEEELFEEDAEKDDKDDKEELISDEDLRIESLKIATNMAKLMANVTPEDIIAVAEKVADFIRNHQIGGATETVTNTPNNDGEVSAEDFANSIEDEEKKEGSETTTNDDARTSDNGGEKKEESEEKPKE